MDGGGGPPLLARGSGSEERALRYGVPESCWRAIVRRSRSVARPPQAPPPGSPYARIAGATVCVRAATVKGEPRSEERTTEGKAIEAIKQLKPNQLNPYNRSHQLNPN